MISFADQTDIYRQMVTSSAAHFRKASGRQLLTAKDVIKPLSGLNKTQTALLYREALTNPGFNKTVMRGKSHKDYDALVMAGYAIVRKAGANYVYRFCANGEEGIQVKDLDWSIIAMPES